MTEAYYTSFIMPRSARGPRQVERTQTVPKLIFKPASTAKATLKGLVESLASNDPVKRNSAINNHLASQAIWHAHGITIQGAARIKHFLNALAMLNLHNQPLRIPLTEIEWDALSTTARIHTVRRVRPILLPLFEFSIPVDTVLVFNADSEPNVVTHGAQTQLPRPPHAPTRAQILVEQTVTDSMASYEESTSLFITKWEEEWPVDAMLSSLPWPLTIYAAILQTFFLPLLVMFLIAWAEVLFTTQERIRHLYQAGQRALSHVSHWTSHLTEPMGRQLEYYLPTVHHYLPRSVPSPRQAGHIVLSAALTLLYGPARVLESSVQLTTETLNTFLPASAQLPSPRVLDWYEEQHARSLKRQQEIHSIRVRGSPSIRQRQKSQEEKQSGTHTAGLAGGSSSKIDRALFVQGFESTEGLSPEPDMPLRTKSPTSTHSATQIPSTPHELGQSKPRLRSGSTSLQGSPVSRSVLSHRRDHDDAGMHSDEGAVLPDTKRARRGHVEDIAAAQPREGETARGDDSDDEIGTGTETGTETAERESSISSLYGEKKFGHPVGGSKDKGKHKTVTFTPSGILPASGLGSALGSGSEPAIPRVSPATKTTFTSTLTDPEGAMAAADVKQDVPSAHHHHPSPSTSVGGGGQAQHGLGIIMPPSASIAAEQLGAALAEDEEARRSEESAHHDRPAAMHEEKQGGQHEHEHEHKSEPSTTSFVEETTKETELVRPSVTEPTYPSTSSSSYHSADIAPLGTAPVIGTSMLPPPEEAFNGHQAPDDDDDDHHPLVQSNPFPTAHEHHQEGRRGSKPGGSGFGTGVKQKMAQWKSKGSKALRPTSREQRKDPI